MARGWNRLYFCCVALVAAICLFARFCAGRRCCYRTVVPSMRAYVILFIATGTLLPVLVIIMCPTGSKIMSQNIAIFRTANCAFCFFGAGCRTAGAVDRLCGVAGAVVAVGAVAIRCPRTPIVGMIVAGLGLERRQGLASCGQILTLAVPWVFAVSAVIDEQCQHRAVAKLRGSLGAGGFIDCAAIVPDGLCGCGIQIIAVSYGAFGYADNTADIACSCPCRRHQRAYAVAVGYGGAGKVDVAHDTAYLGNIFNIVAGITDRYCTQIVAVGYGIARREFAARDTTGGALSQFVAGDIDLTGVVTVFDDHISAQGAYNTGSLACATIVVAASRLDNSGIDAAHNGGVFGKPYDTTNVQVAAASTGDEFTYNTAVIAAILNG